MRILTRCQGDGCVVNDGEGLTAVEGQRDKRCDRKFLSFDNEKELAVGVGKVPLLVGAYATVVVHKEDGLVQKNVSVEELRKPTGSNGGRESRHTRSLQLRCRRETTV
ncbi:hypothetical protein B296_00046422 [Ensete ventricosum]|uniref:Uncharacterized protein n=1 Tax=Ensete ventricosum TaxID=4639 RepID=A0A426XEE5_ENSVE|nr:hypothetical protein B296_00046422 [Ensete ventricosum]